MRHSSLLSSRSAPPSSVRRLAEELLRPTRFLGALVLAAPAVLAQASFTEDFDSLGALVSGQLGPATLSQQGWSFRNQGNATSPPYTWREGPYHVATCGYNSFGSQGGAGFLAADFKSVQGGRLADWAVLPVVAGQVAGDEISFYARQILDGIDGVLEVRYSPSGGTSSGSGVDDVGDFTQVLLTVEPLSGSSWEFHSVPLPGSGRLALRYFTRGLVPNCTHVFGLDTLRVGPASGPCAEYPVVPASGQTVVWTAAAGPHRICATTEIPAGATVVVEAGAVVLVDAGSVLEVRGDLQVQAGAMLDTPYLGSVHVYGTASFVGTPTNPVLLTGGPRSSFSTAPERVAAFPGGRVTLQDVDLRTTISSLGTGLVLATSVVADGQGNGFYAAGEASTAGGNLAIRRSSFIRGAEIWTHGSYLLIDDSSFDDALLRSGRPWAGQTLFLDNLVAVNKTADSVFYLTAGDHFFGANNLIANNRYPVMLDGGGIAPGSALPSSGNVFNRVHSRASANGHRVHYANTGLPYELETGVAPYSIAGRIDVEPGTHFLVAPGLEVQVAGSDDLNLEGLPEAPIVFEPRDPGSPWSGLLFGTNSRRPRLEHTVLRGALQAVGAEQTLVRLESSLIEGNQVGIEARQFAEIVARGCSYFGNVIGARVGFGGNGGALRLDADGNPSWFEGNGTAVHTRLTFASGPSQARGNYWGDPSGPTHPSNPVGQGDTVIGPSEVLPFRSSPPPPNHAPVVRLEKHSPLLEEGAKLILHWTARDDDAITGFRILHSPHGENPGLSLLVADIPGSARSWEITVPAAPPASNYPELSALRVEATDTLGQTGYDDIVFHTPYLNGFVGGFQPDDLLGEQRPGQPFAICGQFYGGANVGATYAGSVWFEGDDQEFPLGSGVQGCGFVREMPAFSTDLARLVAVHTAGANGLVTYSFSDYFSVRPDPAMGDLPPQVSLLSPVATQAYVGGSTVRVSWVASDDEELRSFDLHASYDDGRTWSTVVHDLDAGTREYRWKLPPSGGIDAVRVRVVARDRRFQNSSATSGAFAVLQGPRTRYQDRTGLVPR